MLLRAILKHKKVGRPRKLDDEKLPEKIITGYAVKSRLIPNEKAITQEKLEKRTIYFSYESAR